MCDFCIVKSNPAPVGQAQVVLRSAQPWLFCYVGRIVIARKLEVHVTSFLQHSMESTEVVLLLVIFSLIKFKLKKSQRRLCAAGRNTAEIYMRPYSEPMRECRMT